MNDRITKLDKLDALREEQLKRKGDRASSTYYQQALVDLGLEHSTGRFASKPIVTGQTKAVEYPAASSPWSSSADPGIEMPTGVAIDQMEPVGTYEEMKSQSRNRAGQMLTHPALISNHWRLIKALACPLSWRWTRILSPARSNGRPALTLLRPPPSLQRSWPGTVRG